MFSDNFLVLSHFLFFEIKIKKNGGVADFEILFFPQIVKELTSEEVAFETFKKINDSQTSNDPKYYGGDFQINEDHGTSHTSILAPNGDAVAVTSTINLT